MTPSRRAYQRQYQIQWRANRRNTFFKDKKCFKCNSTCRLELHHVDPAQKVSHHIWTWKPDRQAAEIAKCQVLCHYCHQKETSQYVRQQMLGKPNTACRKLTQEQACCIRRELAAGATERSVATKYGLGKTTIHLIKTAANYYAG